MPLSRGYTAHLGGERGVSGGPVMTSGSVIGVNSIGIDPETGTVADIASVLELTVNVALNGEPPEDVALSQLARIGAIVVTNLTAWDS